MALLLHVYLFLSQRRALAEETEKQEDIERIEAVTKRETGEAKAQYDLEQKVRYVHVGLPIASDLESGL